jgi:hypothetical protein
MLGRKKIRERGEDNYSSPRRRGHKLKQRRDGGSTVERGIWQRYRGSI